MRLLRAEKEERQGEEMQELKRRDLEALRTLADAFDEEERAVVLSVTPVNELIKALEGKCADMAAKLASIEAITKQ